MSIVRRFAVARLNAAARPAALRVGALDETGQEEGSLMPISVSTAL
jgi:hypothetical protein